MTPDQVAEVAKLLPVLIAAATLLAMVNLRNTDLASRYRANVKEARDQTISAKRWINLLVQNIFFLGRYFLTSATFIFLAFSLTCFAVYGLKVLATMPPEDLVSIFDRSINRYFGLHLHPQELFTLEYGVTTFFWGLWGLVAEFALGIITLILDGLPVLRWFK